MGTITLTINGTELTDEFASPNELTGHYLAARAALETFEGEDVFVIYDIQHNGKKYGHMDYCKKKNLGVLIAIQTSIYRMRLKQTQ